MRTRIAMSSLVVLALVAVAWAADPKLEGVKCIVAAKNPAKAEKSVDYKGGKIFFCCDNCPKAYAKDPEKYAAAANAQLVQTGQAKQVACPMTGKALNPDAKTKVGAVEVGFCCEGCLGKVTAAKEEDKPALVFSDKAFEKGFKVGDAK